ncbi:unnamed protein product [Discula destructiva]
MPSPRPPLHVAIVGGGITGLCLGIGLHARNVPFTIYERAPGVHEVGAGIGLSPNAEWAMKALAPAVHAAYERVANPNGEDYFQWVNGVSKELLFKLFVGEGRFRGCRRSEFLEELIKCLPTERVRFGKMVEEVREGREGGVVLSFTDGSEEVADTVVASDGINSRLRAHLFPGPPSTAATYTHKTSFRALVPLADAHARLGPSMVATRFMYNGPGAHIITYPVAGNAFLNVLVVISSALLLPLPSSSSRYKTTKRQEVERAFGGWHVDVRAIVGLLPAEMERWDIFDMCEGPVARYYSVLPRGGVVCLAGDAAHAVGPHLGAGAGFGIEDAALLAELLRGVSDGQDGSWRRMSRLLEAAYYVFTEVRYERTQWLVRATREAVDLFEWKEPEVANDAEGFGTEITSRFHKIWYYDVEKMVEDGKEQLAAALDRMELGS